MRRFTRQGFGAAAVGLVALAALAVGARGAPDPSACGPFAAALLSLSILFVARRKAR